MKDVDTLCFGVLEEHKLRLQPHPITTASKSTVNMFLVDLTGIVREFFGNIATQHLLDLHARFEGCQSATDDSRLFSSMLMANWCGPVPYPAHLHQAQCCVLLHRLAQVHVGQGPGASRHHARRP